MSFAEALEALSKHFAYAEDDTFRWADVVALLIIRLTNTDSLVKERPESHATQIQLTDAGDPPEGYASKTESFFPTLTLNSVFKSWRLEVPVRIHRVNVKRLASRESDEDGWASDRLQIRRRLLNPGEGDNPCLHICYGDDLRPLRERLSKDDYLILVHRRHQPVYEAFGIRKGELDLGSGKSLLVDTTRATQDATVFGLGAMYNPKEEPKVPAKAKVTPEALPRDLASNSPCGLVGLGDSFRRAVTAIRTGKHLIFIGPPGTGKTELAKCVCGFLEKQYTLSTATADWSTFETIGGYMPLPSSGLGSSLDFHPGLVTAAMQNDRWLIIDEINRADMDKAFGELFTLLTSGEVALPYMKRVGEAALPVTLAIGESATDSGYSVRANAGWRLLATMNSLDKASLYQLSYAFLRRFAVIDVPVPSEEDYGRLLGVAADKLDWLSQEVKDFACPMVRLFFASSGPQGLRDKALAVGPAIAKDVLSYISARVREAEQSSPEGVRVAFMEALNAFLFPQFEGFSEQHESIVEVIRAACPGTDQSWEARLRVWTGFRP